MQRGQHWQQQQATLTHPPTASTIQPANLGFCCCLLRFKLSTQFQFFALPAQPAKVFAAICVTRLGFGCSSPHPLLVLPDVSLTKRPPPLLLPQRAVHRLCQLNLLLSPVLAHLRLSDLASVQFSLRTFSRVKKLS